MNKIYFGMCLHFHQPVGNFDSILERAYQNCYKPFLDTFEKYPDIKMAMHFSGCLLDYFEEKHPDFLDRIKAMVDRGQVEIVGGGYYEPIFVSIPEKDRTGQIKMMSDYVKKRFMQNVQGMWTPERVWLPELARDFNKAGMKYTILDDEHFIKAGLDKEELFGYFTTGEKNKEIAVFPSSKKLRYMMPFKMPGDIMNYFKETSSKKQEPLFTYGDDAEKFGEWPFTYDWVHKKEWLKKFFDELTKNKEWVKTVKLSDYLKSNPPIKKIKIPEASYQEMMEWSGGSWLNFLKRYPEANQMVRKMHYVSEKIRDRGQGTGDRVEIEKAKKELYKGQCNCAYWHGVFGGLYLYHLRKAIYEHLINAEKIVDRILHKGKKDWVEIKELDFYEDGKKVFIIENEEISLCIDPKSGGIIRELDARGASTNIINSIARHEEEYHKKILAKMNKSADAGAVRTIHEDVKSIDPGMKSEFCYDGHIRGWLVDHFISKDTTLNDFINCKFTELGDFVNTPYEAERRKNKIILSRKGQNFSIAKEIKLSDRKELEISYSIKNIGKSSIDIIFGPEFNITMPYLNSDRYNYYADGRILAGLNNQSSASGTSSFSIKDSEKELDINFSFPEKPAEIWYFPVKTVSQSERAYELNYQASCVLPRWILKIPASKQAAFTISIQTSIACLYS